MNKKLTQFLAFGPNTWGKGITPGEAIENMKTAGGTRREYDLFRIHPKTEVGGTGEFCYPMGKKPREFAPVLIKRVRNYREKALPAV